MSFTISPSNEHSGLISFRIDWLDLLAVQGTLKSLAPQFEKINSSTLTAVLDYWKNHVQLCLTLCDPMDRSLPGSSVHGIFQARVLEWVAIAVSVYRYKSWTIKVEC